MGAPVEFFDDDETEVNLDLEGALEAVVVAEERTQSQLRIWDEVWDDGPVPVAFEDEPSTRNERPAARRWHSDVSHLVEDLIDFDDEPSLPELAPHEYTEVKAVVAPVARIRLVKGQPVDEGAKETEPEVVATPVKRRFDLAGLVRVAGTVLAAWVAWASTF